MTRFRIERHNYNPGWFADVIDTETGEMVHSTEVKKTAWDATKAAKRWIEKRLEREEVKV